MIERKADGLYGFRVLVKIPGEPHAQGRGRAFAFRKAGKLKARVVDPKASRDWKATAQQHMVDALVAMELSFQPAFPDGPLRLRIIATWTLARSHWRKTPVARAWKEGKPDPDNVAKAVMDAGNGVLWRDDSQIALLEVARIRAAQGEAPGVEVIVDRPPQLDATVEQDGWR